MKLTNFVLIEERIWDIRFGTISIYKERSRDDILIFEKSRNSHSKEDHEFSVLQAKSRQKLSHPNMLRMLGIIHDDVKWSTSAYFDYPNCDLIDAMGRLTDPKETVRFLADILEVIIYLEDLDMVHGDVRPEFIYFHPRLQRYVLLDRMIDDSSVFQAQMNNLFQNEKDLFMSPDLFEQLGKDDKQPTINPFKNEVFSLGILLLCLVTPNSEDFELYDRGRRVFNDSKMNEMLSLATTFNQPDPLSKMLKELMRNNILCVKERKRMSPKQALGYLRKEVFQLLNIVGPILSPKNRGGQIPFGDVAKNPIAEIDEDWSTSEKSEADSHSNAKKDIKVSYFSKKNEGDETSSEEVKLYVHVSEDESSESTSNKYANREKILNLMKNEWNSNGSTQQFKSLDNLRTLNNIYESSISNLDDYLLSQEKLPGRLIRGFQKKPLTSGQTQMDADRQLLKVTKGANFESNEQASELDPKNLERSGQDNSSFVSNSKSNAVFRGTIERQFKSKYFQDSESEHHFDIDSVNLALKLNSVEQNSKKVFDFKSVDSDSHSFFSYEGRSSGKSGSRGFLLKHARRGSEGIPIFIEELPVKEESDEDLESIGKSEANEAEPNKMQGIQNSLSNIDFLRPKPATKEAVSIESRQSPRLLSVEELEIPENSTESSFKKSANAFESGNSQSSSMQHTDITIENIPRNSKSRFEMSSMGTSKRQGRVSMSSTIGRKRLNQSSPKQAISDFKTQQRAKERVSERNQTDCQSDLVDLILGQMLEPESADPSRRDSLKDSLEKRLKRINLENRVFSLRNVPKKTISVDFQSLQGGDLDVQALKSFEKILTKEAKENLKNLSQILKVSEKSNQGGITVGTDEVLMSVDKLRQETENSIIEQPLDSLESAEEFQLIVMKPQGNQAKLKFENAESKVKGGVSTGKDETKRETVQDRKSETEKSKTRTSTRDNPNGDEKVQPETPESAQAKSITLSKIREMQLQEALQENELSPTTNEDASSNKNLLGSDFSNFTESNRKKVEILNSANKENAPEPQPERKYSNFFKQKENEQILTDSSHWPKTLKIETNDQTKTMESNLCSSSDDSNLVKLEFPKFDVRARRVQDIKAKRHIPGNDFQSQHRPKDLQRLEDTLVNKSLRLRGKFDQESRKFEQSNRVFVRDFPQNSSTTQNTVTSLQSEPVESVSESEMTQMGAEDQSSEKSEERFEELISEIEERFNRSFKQSIKRSQSDLHSVGGAKDQQGVFAKKKQVVNLTSQEFQLGQKKFQKQMDEKRRVDSVELKELRELVRRAQAQINSDLPRKKRKNKAKGETVNKAMVWGKGADWAQLQRAKKQKLQKQIKEKRLKTLKKRKRRKLVESKVVRKKIRQVEDNHLKTEKKLPKSQFEISQSGLIRETKHNLDLFASKGFWYQQSKLEQNAEIRNMTGFEYMNESSRGDAKIEHTSEYIYAQRPARDALDISQSYSHVHRQQPVEEGPIKFHLSYLGESPEAQLALAKSFELARSVVKFENAQFSEISQFLSSPKKANASTQEVEAPSARRFTLKKSEHPRSTSQAPGSEDSFNVDLFGKVQLDSEMGSIQNESDRSRFIESRRQINGIPPAKGPDSKVDEHESPRKWNRRIHLDRWDVSQEIQGNSEYDLFRTMKVKSTFGNQLKETPSQGSLGGKKAARRVESVQSILSDTNSLPIKTTSKKQAFRRPRKKRKTIKFGNFRQKVRKSSGKSPIQKSDQEIKTTRVPNSNPKPTSRALPSHQEPKRSASGSYRRKKRIDSKSVDEGVARPRIISKTRHVKNGQVKAPAIQRRRKIVRITRSYSPIGRRPNPQVELNTEAKNKDVLIQKKTITMPVTRFRPRTRFVNWKNF